jgi:hypothetical protein
MTASHASALLASLLRLALFSGNYSKEKSNHFNEMGDNLGGGGNNKIKIDFNLK